MLNIEAVRFDANGLVPAIVQDVQTGQVLTLAYMNRESLQISIAEKRTCFYSRSRQALWRKGETSGNTQEIVSITADCDSDALLVRVRKAGPACHTGAESCFFQPVFADGDTVPFSMDSLYALLEQRNAERPQGSYTTYLFEKGEDKILKKVGEECTEVVIAAKNSDNDELLYEIADLAYHTLVLMVHKQIAPQQVRDELASRHVIDKKVKQETMGGKG